MNIIELNKQLYDLMDKVEKGEVDLKKAQTMINISNAINSNAKLMCSVAKLSKDPHIVQNLIGVEPSKQITTETSPKDLFDLKLNYARSLGYENLGEALAAAGKHKFEEGFKKYLEEI